MTQPLKVNFSSEEAGSTVRQVPPSGDYVVNIVDGELKTVKPGRKNTGKQFWQIKFVVQDGDYAGTSLMSSVMLFDGALYSFAWLMRALGYTIEAGDFRVPPLDELFGKTLIVTGMKMPPKTLPDNTELSERFEIRGYKEFKTGSVSKSSSSSLLPS